MITALRARWSATTPTLQGIIWVGLSTLLFSLLNVATFYPATNLDNSYMMSFLRYAFGSLFLLPIFLRRGPLQPFRTERFGFHAARAALHTGGMLLWFIALPVVSLADITALGFTGPIFVTIGAAMFLGEKVRLRRWAAVVVGFIGALVIIRPGFETVSLATLAVLASTPLFSASNLMAKALARTDSADTIVVWQSILIATFALPFALWHWETPGWSDIGWLMLAGFFGTAGHLAMQRGYQLADITVLQPIGFLALIWNTIMGFLLFTQRPDVWTFVGAAIIFGSATYISHREAVRRSRARSAGTDPAP
jgi:drug/metabolite transporter (DMT)-like permease